MRTTRTEIAAAAAGTLGRTYQNRVFGAEARFDGNVVD